MTSFNWGHCRTLSNTQVLFSGPLSGFPFDDGSGQFDVIAQIDNATYQFDPDWPAVTNANVKLHFANERMDIYSQQGQLVNLDIGSSVHVSIDDLMGDAPLVVSINKQAELERRLWYRLRLFELLKKITFRYIKNRSKLC